MVWIDSDAWGCQELADDVVVEAEVDVEVAGFDEDVLEEELVDDVVPDESVFLADEDESDSFGD